MLKKKRIYLNEERTKYCTVRLYLHKSDMQAAYKKYRRNDDGHDTVEGVHCANERVEIDGSNEKLLPETGIVFLHFNCCGAGVVSHEFNHAALWAWKHRLGKSANQYPIIISSMEEEEEILQMHTYAVTQFYRWYWKIEKLFKAHGTNS